MPTVVLLLDRNKKLVAAMLPDHAPPGMHYTLVPEVGQTMHTVDLAGDPRQLAPVELKRLVTEKLAQPNALKPYVETRRTRR